MNPQERQDGEARKRPRDHKSKQREAMVTRILDGAERLFARYGFHGVTLKDIAAHVGIGSTLVHYHFDGKERIFDALWARRAPISANRRIEAMRRYDESVGGAITVEGALHAWLDPDLLLVARGGPEWTAFGMIASQTNTAAGWGTERMEEHFAPVALALVDLLRRALPDCDERTLFWGYHFMTGSISHNFAQTGRLEILSDGLCASHDLDAIRWHMATFMAAGFHAICRHGPYEPTRD